VAAPAHRPRRRDGPSRQRPITGAELAWLLVDVTAGCLTPSERSLFVDIACEQRSVPSSVSQGHEPRGLALNAFTSVTVSPAMVLVCVAKSSTTHDALFAADHFAVNLLSSNQLDIARRFATKSTDEFSQLDWHHGDYGCPIIDNSCAHLEAEITMRVRTSAHTVFFGRVLNANSSEAAPLVYLGAEFFDGAQLQPMPR
jgi:flavin reductase (DIM6/NTAB) family NADH-FMN oxidoreductase RutF